MTYTLTFASRTGFVSRTGFWAVPRCQSPMSVRRSRRGREFRKLTSYNCSAFVALPLHLRETTTTTQYGRALMSLRNRVFRNKEFRRQIYRLSRGASPIKSIFRISNVLKEATVALLKQLSRYSFRSRPAGVWCALRSMNQWQMMACYRLRIRAAMRNSSKFSKTARRS